MLSQALIKTLLESPLPLRLALLDADPMRDCDKRTVYKINRRMGWL